MVSVASNSGISHRKGGTDMAKETSLAGTLAGTWAYRSYLNQADQRPFAPVSSRARFRHQQP
jgi:hypothetical protein